MLRFFAIPVGENDMQAWDLLLTETRAATMAGGAYGIIEDAAVGISNGRIAWIGAAKDLPACEADETRSLAGRWLTPALIDCHTHLVFAGNRAAEFEQRLKGASYEEIARSGGGIMSTVSATRAADTDILMDQTAARLALLRAEGCATVEIKSGYGLNTDTELRLLEIARNLARQLAISVSTTFLGAHSVPAEYKGRTDDYVSLVCDEMLPAVKERGLADAVDAYCEPIAFSAAQVARVFEKAQSLGLPVKLHADQLSDSGGAELAASFGALSADHLEYTHFNGVRALADAGTVAVLLPGAFLTLGETKLPPVNQLRDEDVPIAIATDCNPGTSPVCSIRTTMTLATSLFKLTPEECLAGVTINAARALGHADRGTLEAGKRADIAAWNIDHPQELSYWIGTNELAELYVEGRRL
jgi:imidazolonepropionase